MTAIFTAYNNALPIADS